MFCSKCGQKLEEDSKFCIKCGTPVNMSSVPSTPPTVEAFGNIATEQTQKNELSETSSQKSEAETKMNNKQDNFFNYIYIITGILFVSGLFLHGDIGGIIGILALVAFVASGVINIIQIIRKAKTEAATVKKMKVDTTICPKCKEPIGKNDGYCEKCGAIIDNPKRNLFFWLSFVIIFAIWSAITIINDWSSLMMFIGLIPAFIFPALLTNKIFSKRK